MKFQILFVCVGNSARSQMAEALLRHMAGDIFDVYSAGTQAETVDARALNALLEAGIPVDHLEAKPISVFADRSFDYVITLCDKALLECGPTPASREYLTWNFADPKLREGIKPFETTLHEIRERIKMFLLIHNKKNTMAP